MPDTTQITHEAVDAAITLDRFHFPVEEEHDCPTCGEPFEEGQQALEVYAPDAFALGNHRAVWFVHLRCFQGEEIAT